MAENVSEGNGAQGEKVEVNEAGRVLASGFDSLYLSLFIIWKHDGFFRLLDDLKKNAAAQGVAMPGEIEAGKHRWVFNVESFGSRGFAWLLTSHEYDIKLLNALSPISRPSAVIEIRSVALWQNGAIESIVRILELLKGQGATIVHAKTSRADPCVDTLLPAHIWKPELERHVVSRGEYTNASRKNMRFTCLRVGSGDIQFRLYDKHYEIETSSHKTWMYDIWGLKEVPEGYCVLRSEFQLRREVLRELGVDSVWDLTNHSRNPQGDGWYVAYHDGSKRQRRSLGVATKPEAEAAVKTLDEPPTAAQQAKHRASWSDVQKGFLQHKASLDKAASTLAQYGYALDAFGRYIASKAVQYVDEVSLNILEGFKEFEMKQEGCDVNTAYHYSIIVKGAFKWASKAARGYLAVNPALDWETPAPVKPKRYTYSLPDVEKMEAGVREWLRPVVTVLAWSGLRINELVNLRWQDVDLERRLIHIRVQESWKPKGKRDRIVPMHPKVDAVLKSQPVGEYAFPAVKGGMLCARSSRRSLREDQKRLGIQCGDLHAFRRFFATTMIRNGVDAETVRQWGGWKTFQTMLRYLADVNAKDSVTAMDLAVSRINAAAEKSGKETTKKPA